MVLFVLILLAILVQFLVDRVKSIVPVKSIGKVELAPIYSLVFGLLVAFVAKVDILALLELDTVSVIGYVLTGLAVSGGAEAIHELIAKIRDSRSDT